MDLLTQGFQSIWPQHNHHRTVGEKKASLISSSSLFDLRQRQQKPPEKEQQNDFVCFPGKSAFGQGFVKRYKEAMASKLYDVEELIDFYFHRRIAALIAVGVSYLPFVVTPNHITLFGLGLGWSSASFIHDAYFQTPFANDPIFSHQMASFFMFAWIVSDCADGQVARLCQRGTRTGRILDGVVDGLVLIPNFYVISTIMTVKYGALGWYMTIADGLSLWGHAIIYDKIKNVYSQHVLPGSECDGETTASVYVEYVEAKGMMDCVLLGIYYRYLQIQATFEFSTSTVKSLQHKHDDDDDDDGEVDAVTKQRYRKRYAWVMRLASCLGISAHVTGFYISYFIASIFPTLSFLLLHFYFSIVLNIICAIVLYQYSTNGMIKPPLSTMQHQD